MQPLYDALNDFLPVKQVSKMLEDKKIEIIPLAFMRGRTLSNSFIILDEGQNTTSNQMKMFLTRLGRNSKAAVTGDLTQIDLPKGFVSGLYEATKILNKLNDIGFVYFTSKDVVRHNLVQKIVNAYDSRSCKIDNLMSAKINIQIQEKKWSKVDLRKLSKKAFKSTFKILSYPQFFKFLEVSIFCLLYTSDAADE